MLPKPWHAGTKTNTDEHVEVETNDERARATSDSEEEEAAFWIPLPAADEPVYYFNALTGVSRMVLPPETLRRSMEFSQLLYTGREDTGDRPASIKRHREDTKDRPIMEKVDRKLAYFRHRGFDPCRPVIYTRMKEARSMSH